MTTTRSRALAAIGLVGALALVMSAAAGSPPRQKGGPTGPPINTPMQPWTGAMGITLTVDEIMAREYAMPIFEGPQTYYYGVEHEMSTHPKGKNPNAPLVSQWPPAVGAKNSERPKGDGVGRYSPQALGTAFDGVVLGEAFALPPDSNGAVGPTQIMFAENGRIKVFSRSGALGALNLTDSAFFSSVTGGAGLSDPQVRYDRLSQRWFVLMITTNTPNRIVLAVSSGPTIVNSASFTFFQFQQDLVAPAGNTNQFADYCSLGVDANALYVGCNMFAGNTFAGVSGWVIRKSSVLGAGPIVATAFRGLTAGNQGPLSPRGVDNDDPAATEGYFIGVDINLFSTLMVRRISDPGGTPSISGNISLTVPTTVYPRAVAALGSVRALDALDDRLFYATLRRNRLTGQTTLWTAHNMRVTSAGVANSGVAGDRVGSRWYQIQNMTTTPSLLQSGTVFDNAATTPKSYWIPSVTMNGQGHMAIGVSQAGAAARADIAVAGRWSTDPLGTTQGATQATFTAFSYNAQTGGTDPQRWGDYSMTVVDPNDDMTMWTFQEYCNANNSWAVRAVQIISAPPATITTLVPNTINQGQTTNIVVNGSSVSNSGFFDPGAGFANRLAASLSGSGLTVNSVTFTSPTQFTMSVTAAGGANPGARNLTVTNPDGQTSVQNNALTVNATGPTTVNPTSFNVSPGLIQSGGLSDLFLSDDSYLVLKRNLAADQVGYTVTLFVTSTSPTANPTSFQFRSEARAQVNGLRQHIDLFDYVAGAWVSMDVRMAPQTDTVVTVTGTGDLSRFVQAGTRTIRARVGLSEFAIDSASAWLGYFDQQVWLIGQ